MSGEFLSVAQCDWYLNWVPFAEACFLFGVGPVLLEKQLRSSPLCGRQYMKPGGEALRRAQCERGYLSGLCGSAMSGEFLSVAQRDWYLNWVPFAEACFLFGVGLVLLEKQLRSSPLCGRQYMKPGGEALRRAQRERVFLSGLWGSRCLGGYFSAARVHDVSVRSRALGHFDGLSANGVPFRLMGIAMSGRVFERSQGA